ncbi:MAG: hypothetical protein JEY94_14235 [Melioribacteraceae bacterium]|nr:hypothetical protein [Melioribacteraceae bacterium]
MSYLIGMDGGGTKTKCVITDFEYNVQHECTGGPSTFLINGTETVSETLYKLITECKEKLSIGFSDIKSIVLGTTGAGRRSDAERMENAFKLYCDNKGVELKNFSVESDARIALEGAFSGKPGSIFIAGTGSIMFGKDIEGEIHRVGGFGRFIGDEGSGYMLGKLGLTAVAKELDGRGISTMLTKMIAAQFGITEAPQLIIEIYKNNFDIASVAPLVIEAAEKEDEICSEIVDHEVEELVLHIRAMKEKITEKRFYLSLIGGTITTDNYYARLFKEKVFKLFPDVFIKDADYPPELGAVIMAKKKLHVVE